VELDFERCYRAVDSRDPRFDGWFVTAVLTTGIYCRPSCPAVTPKPQNVTFYPTAAAAHRVGFRACRRCRPDAAPGSPEWDNRADVVGRAMRLIADGTVDREGVDGLASRLGYGARHLHRMLSEEVGAGPLALARAQRAQTARILVETTDMPLTDVAFAAGFGSIRQFNDTVREVFASSPTQLRTAAHRTTPRHSGTIAVRLAYRPPLHRAALLEFLAARAVPSVESVTGGHYARALRLPHGTATVLLTPLDTYVAATFHLADLRDLAPAVARCRRLLDLDADPIAIDEVLGADSALRRAVRTEPGIRVPRAVDGFEIAMRAVVGQQISVSSAVTVLDRIVRAAATGPEATGPEGTRPHGTRPDNIGPDSVGPEIIGPDPTEGCAGSAGQFPEAGPLIPFPEARAVAALSDADLPMPAARKATVRALAEAVADGKVVLDGGEDRAEVEEALRSIPGIGAWTANYVAMRALGDPDVFLETDLAVVRGAGRAGLPTSKARLHMHSLRWAPWRSYAVVRLWRM